MWSDDDEDLKHAMQGDEEGCCPPFWLAILIFAAFSLVISAAVSLLSS